MGKYLDYNIYETENYNEAISLWKRDFQEALKIYGDDPYSETIVTLNQGSARVGVFFKSSDEAIKWIESLGKKGIYYICRFGNPNVIVSNVIKRKKDTKKIEQLKHDIKIYNETILNKIINSKAKTIGCKSCGKRIERKTLTSIKCPECNNNLYNKIQIKKLESMVKKYNKLQDKVPVNGGYVIGGWCPQ